GIGYVSQLRRRLTMIMQGNTPRSLSALGWIVVLTLGLCLMPLAAQAQTPQKLGGEKDQEIKVLKERLRAVEQGQRQEARQAAEAARRAERAARAALRDFTVALDDEESEQADQAMQTIAELKRLIAEKRAELDGLERKLKIAVDQLDGQKG